MEEPIQFSDPVKDVNVLTEGRYSVFKAALNTRVSFTAASYSAVNCVNFQQIKRNLAGFLKGILYQIKQNSNPIFNTDSMVHRR